MATSSQTTTVVEICAGAGGQALGLEKAGFTHAATVEIDRDACETLEANRGEWNPVLGDVTDPSVFNPSAFEGVDLLAGGVPCPPFSIAGKQMGAQDERDLYAWAVNLVPVVRPKALMLENVRGLSGRRFAGYRSHVEGLLESWGYTAEWRLLQASDFGVPQLRPRFILVALQEDLAPYFRWPEKLDGEPPTVGETLYDLMASNGWQGAKQWSERANGIAPTVVGGSKKHGGADLGPTRAKRAWAELGVDGHGVADAAPAREAPTHLQPKLTNRMVARIQGWDDNWEFRGLKTSTYRQIGNAFPPPVAEAVGRSVRSAILQLGVPRSRQERSLELDSAVYRVLAANQDKFVTGQALTDATGQTAEEIEKAIAHLDADFEIAVRRSGGLPRYRLLEFKGRSGRVDELEVA